MPAFVPLGRYKITYLDGRTVEAVSNFGAIMELESERPESDGPRGTTLTHAVWLYLDKPDADLRTWANSVHLIEPIEDTDAVDPSPPVAAVG